MTKLEECARAIAKEAEGFERPVSLYVEWEAVQRWEIEHPGQDFPHGQLDAGVESWKILVRAVLLALREPSPEMCNAIDDVEFDNSHSSTLVRQWQAGISAVLDNKA